MESNPSRYWRENYDGGRLKRVYEFIKDEKAFCFTYGDGLEKLILKN